MIGLSIISTFATILAIISIVGLLLIWFGVRGKTVNNHPHCRKCRFDLVGTIPADAVTDAAPLSTLKCPECGTDLNPFARRVQYGLKRPRWGFIRFGFALLLPFAGVVVAGAVTSFTSYNIATALPAAVLVEQVKSAGKSGPAAITEILRRYKAGELSREQVSGAIDGALAVQANRKLPWDPKLGDLIELARTQGDASEAQWKAYAANAVEFVVTTRERTARGATVQFNYRNDSIRVATASRLACACTINGVLLDGKVLNGGQSMWSGNLANSRGSSGGVGYQLDLPLGRNTVVFSASLAITDGATSPPTAIITSKVERPLPIEVLDDPANVIKAVSNESLRSRIESSIKAQRVAINASSNRLNVDLQLAISTNFVIGLGFEIFWRKADPAAPGGVREWRIGNVSYFGDGSGNQLVSGLGGDVTGFTGDSVDIILRPSPTAGLGNASITEIWDGEIILNNVPVTWPKPIPEDPIDPEELKPGSLKVPSK